MPNYDKALFLYNGNAGANDMEQKLAQTLPVLAKVIKELTVIQTNSVEEAKRTCVTFAKQIDLLIILGGDGTVHTCINSIAALEKRPVIAILPGGTSNDFSRMLQMPQNLKQAAGTIVDGETVDIDLGKSGEKYFLNFWGIGLVSEASQNINEDQKNSFGILSYFMSTLRSVNQAEPFHYEVQADDATHDGEAVMILVLNGKFIGTRELPIPSIAPNDGKLDVLIVKNSTLASFRELLSMNNPNIDSEQLNELDYFQATDLKVTTDSYQDIDMDGEISETTPSEIVLLPGHIRMVRSRG
ncbi:YegS/Rv2252/BmrU family lipid kinase [Virgibacillus sp. NKC19-16]|uniref:diacylglycerol/lipid kinase family protein n=1 Tax=Virgibacillus salidurans TaxID=2831673 RepID=UPI001F3E522A|nr:YegS/Rv2252/BmrU family lipid kinase [Virgibacillus sp. NKC19-16]UJL47019.1 YegS/Rv2252/BmrU family lipid kinase [Virgibacillus sp. NKC19-16]